jgi:hypothetical protein
VAVFGEGGGFNIKHIVAEHPKKGQPGIVFAKRADA